MDISEGFQIEQPNVFIPWSTSSRERMTLFRDLDLKQVNNNYIVTQRVSLKGLSHKLGFHFDLRPGFGIWHFELFDQSPPFNNPLLFVIPSEAEGSAVRHSGAPYLQVYGLTESIQA
jgi:hypothetical protein